MMKMVKMMEKWSPGNGGKLWKIPSENDRMVEQRWNNCEEMKKWWKGMTSSMRTLARSLHHDDHHHHSPHLHHDHNDQDHQHHHDGQPAGDDLKFDLEKSGEQSPMNRVIEHLPHLPNIIISSSSSSRLSSTSSSTSSKRFLLPLRN